MIGIDLSGRTALVCGASGGGIGTAVSRALSQAGATIIAVDQNAELTQAIKAEIAGQGGTCHTIEANLMDAAVASSLVERALALAGGIDIVANVAGGTRFNQWMPLEETPDDVLQDVFALNFNYVFRVCADAARHMIREKKPGAMINMASIAGLTSAPFHGPYGAAKRALMGLSQTMSVEWARYGIRVNVVAPGGVKSPRASRYRGSGRREGGLGNDGHRTVDPAEVAAGILFLASDLASGISGQVLTIDSGLSAKNYAGGLSQYSAIMESSAALMRGDD